MTAIHPVGGGQDVGGGTVALGEGVSGVKETAARVGICVLVRLGLKIEVGGRVSVGVGISGT